MLMVQHRGSSDRSKVAVAKELGKESVLGTENDRNAEISRNSENGELRRKGEALWQRLYEIG
jgi:hypothetical protein